MTEKTLQCDFCKEFSADEDSTFARLYRNSAGSRILFRSSNFAVMPSLGQIVEGYLLILPNEHFRALGDLPALLLDELVRLCSFIGTNLGALYGPHVLFEHGTRPEGTGGCGIYHAHLHAVPLESTRDPIDILKAKFPFEEFSSLTELQERSAGLSTYLFYRDSSARLYLFDTGPLPSQYMRKLLADLLGEPNWDWRTAGKEERLLTTIERLSSRFKVEKGPVLSI